MNKRERLRVFLEGILTILGLILIAILLIKRESKWENGFIHEATNSVMTSITEDKSPKKDMVDGLNNSKDKMDERGETNGTQAILEKDSGGQNRNRMDWNVELNKALRDGKIRVLLTNPKGGYFFDSITMEYEADNEKKLTQIRSDDLREGEKIQLDSGSNYIVFKEKGIRDANDKYRGTMEIVGSPNGLYVVNELGLEKYLYGVVPSEMPASYPKEALKAQAICARTYAYHFMLDAGLPEYGANLDDTVNYQVYGNMKEQENCNEIVDETSNLVLGRNKEPRILYYYSTSGVNEAESTEPWYRWSYDVEAINNMELWKRLLNAFNKKKVETKLKSSNTYMNNVIVYPKNIKNIVVEKYANNGYVEELLIEGDSYTIKIVSEYMIRSVLCDGHTQVVTQDAVGHDMTMLLPSAYITIEPSRKNENVVGYNISGGGFGHGNGMSQNGAKWMAKDGKNCQEILARYYPDYELFDTIECALD